MIDIQGILERLPHRHPFLMVDRVTALEPGVRAEAVKCVSANEPAFAGHFPGRPILPGVLLLEAFAQVAGIVALSAHPEAAGRVVLLLGADDVRFRRPVTPGDRVVLICERERVRRGIWTFAARAEVEGVLVAEARLHATLAGEEDRA